MNSPCTLFLLPVYGPRWTIAFRHDIQAATNYDYGGLSFSIGMDWPSDSCTRFSLSHSPAPGRDCLFQHFILIIFPTDGRTDGAFRLVLIFTSRLMDPLSGRFHISVSPGVCESLSPAVFFLDFSTPTKEKGQKEKKIPICVTTIVIHNELL